jgi:hypothetical protein
MVILFSYQGSKQHHVNSHYVVVQKSLVIVRHNDTQAVGEGRTSGSQWISRQLPNIRSLQPWPLVNIIYHTKYEKHCEISSSHGGEYDVQSCLLGYTEWLIPDDGGSTHLWNVGRQSFYTAVYPRRQLWTWKTLLQFITACIYSQ